MAEEVKVSEMMKAIEEKKAAPVEKPEEAKPVIEEDRHQLTRAQRREINRAKEEAAELRGRLAAITELGLVPKREAAKAAQTDPEPQRKDFATDAEFNRAAGRWDARQETKKELAKANEGTQQQEDYNRFVEHANKMDEKAALDKAVFEDFDKVVAEMGELQEDDPELQFSIDTHPAFIIANKASKVKAALVYYFATNPEALREILKLKGDKMIEKFRDIEIDAAMLYASKQKPKTGDPEKDAEKPKTLTAAERDALKAKPSEAVSVRGGEATGGKVEMYLPDGRTINPAWKARVNEHSGLRR